MTIRLTWRRTYPRAIWLPITLLLGLLAACGGNAADSPAPATLPPEPATPAASTASTTPGAGRTAEGVYYLGDPEAPVTLTDYSDFL